ncbi:seminal vesicle secretory protein 6-like [Onychomys torridus]|uniref:seminal vesicle secretory protein 6-like n=1 Tax=Onychomys torridus TaxID=38674 RepID=UPI00167FD58D|nr:seminal vesicle secretory protein 6-like [Onychomys torridus]
MNPTSFFLLTLLLVLVTETASRKTRENFSQISEDIDLKTLGGRGGSSSSHDEYSHRESSWNTFKSKSPKTVISEELYEERKHKQCGGDSDGDGEGDAGEMERFIRRKEKQQFGQEINK